MRGTIIMGAMLLVGACAQYEPICDHDDIQFDKWGHVTLPVECEPKTRFTFPTRSDGPDSVPTEPTPEPEQPTSRPDKWERLGEMGINRDNFGDQPKETREQIREYRETHGVKGDWSNFEVN